MLTRGGDLLIAMPMEKNVKAFIVSTFEELEGKLKQFISDELNHFVARTFAHIMLLGCSMWTWAATSTAGYVTYYLFCCVKRPLLAVKSGSCFGKFLTSQLSTLQEKYWPTPWCIESRAQTILASVFRSLLPTIEYQRELVDMADGGVLALDWHRSGDYQTESSSSADDPHPIVLLLPGLTGSSQSDYIRSLILVSETIGANCVVFNQRGSGGVDLKTTRTYNAANTDDLSHVIDLLLTRFPLARIVLVGISMGGMLVGHYLQEYGERAAEKVLAAMIISVPWDVFLSCENIERPVLNLLMDQHLCDCLVDYVKRHEHMLNCDSAPWNFSEVIQARTIKEFDSRFIVKQFGYADVDEYYRAACLNDKLHRIKVPLLGLSAADDPFQPATGIPVHAVTDHVAILVTEHGGHIGFMEGWFPFRRNYTDRVFADFCRAVLNNPQLVTQHSN